MLAKKEILKTIQSNIEQIKSYGVKKIGIFGSFVRFNQNSKSDIDVLVQFHRGRKGI